LLCAGDGGARAAALATAGVKKRSAFSSSLLLITTGLRATCGV